MIFLCSGVSTNLGKCTRPYVVKVEDAFAKLKPLVEANTFLKAFLLGLFVTNRQRVLYELLSTFSVFTLVSCIWYIKILLEIFDLECFKLSMKSVPTFYWSML